MNTEQLKNAAAVMLAAAEGKPIEFKRKSKNSHSWAPSDRWMWDWSDYDYRVAIAKPSINWDHVHPDYKWMAIDQSGKIFLCTSKPYIDGEYWFVGGSYTPAASYASFIPGNCDWTESLVCRPGAE